MKNKGFTLVELLVMLIVLGILIAISVPNISGILADNRNSVMLDYANRMLDDAKVKVTMDKTIKPEFVHNCSVIRLNALDKNNSFKSGPNGGEFDRAESFVVVRLNTISNYSTEKIYNYIYYVRLIEKKGDKLYGLNLALDKDVEEKNKRLYNGDIKLLDVNLNDDITKPQLGILLSGTGVCNEIVKDIRS